jgi:hypothetical protein
MLYQNYEQVKKLDLVVLDEVLKSGDAQERVWAAWEIGLRLGREALPNISLQAHEAPDPGTRRHMVVVLAGLGHYSALSTLAFHDPDESVRGTTTQYIIKTTDESDTDKINFIIKLLQEDKSPVVKQSILANWDFEKQQIPIALLLDSILNNSEDVRKVAIEQITKQFIAKELSDEQIIRCLAYQTNKESIYLFSNWLLKSNLQEYIILSAEISQQSSTLLLLDLLAEKELKFSWKSLRKLTERKNPDIDIRILNILILEKNIDLILWLAFGISRAISLPKVQSRGQYLQQQSAANFHHLAINHFLFLLKNVPPQQIVPSAILNFKTILSHLENDINYLIEYDDEDYWEDEGIDPEEYVKEMNLNCDSIKNWLDMNDL